MPHNLMPTRHCRINPSISCKQAFHPFMHSNKNFYALVRLRALHVDSYNCALIYSQNDYQWRHGEWLFIATDNDDAVWISAS